jgi:hypothetical protein
MATLKRNIKEKDDMLKMDQEEIQKLKKEILDKEAEIRKI